MLLAIDIGNTTIALGGFEGAEPRFVRHLPSDRGMDEDLCAAGIRTLLTEAGAVPALRGGGGSLLGGTRPYGRGRRCGGAPHRPAGSGIGP